MAATKALGNTRNISDIWSSFAAGLVDPAIVNRIIYHALDDEYTWVPLPIQSRD